MRILVVDDDYLCREQMIDHLQSLGRCEIAPNGEIALQLFQEAQKSPFPYELITLDVEMTGIMGPDVVLKMREFEKEIKTPPGKEAKIIMVTSRDELSMVSKAYFKGCNAYLTKPAQAEAVQKTLKELNIIR